LPSEKTLIGLYERIKSCLQSENIDVSEYKLINYGMQFEVSTPSWIGLLRIYQNKKGDLKIDYSQLKDREKSTKIQTLIEGKQTISSLNNGDLGLGYPIIGTDESGKGDYFGPLVTASVYVDEPSARDLIACGVKDSKNLSDIRNLELARKVVEICKGRFVIIEISPEKYNKLYEQFTRENKTLNTLLAWQHAKAIEEILYQVNCNVAIADQFADERFILAKLQDRGKKIEIIQMHKAEQHIAVAAASVLARARFLERNIT
jgi:ribonuclease HIII